jgi:hypothetical protein
MPEIVKIVRRWGSHDAGQTVEVDEQMAAWLVRKLFGERPDRPAPPRPARSPRVVTVRTCARVATSPAVAGCGS